MIDKSVVVSRISALLGTLSGSARNPNAVSEAYNGALNLLRVVHGPDSVQERQLIQAMKTADSAKSLMRMAALHNFVTRAVTGALNALHGDLAAGLTGNLQLQASGEVLGNMLALAKEALANGGEGQKNVAAVLVAAAFEDTLRRLGELKAGVTGRPTLAEVIDRLKASGVLVGAAVSTAVGHLRFRNDALHADWQKVQAPTIAGCLAFVEGLLAQHFS